MRLIAKIQKKLAVWKGNFLSIGGRLIMLNAVVSALPLYYLSIYRIPKWALNKIDQIRRGILWARVDSSTIKKISSSRANEHCSINQMVMEIAL